MTTDRVGALSLERHLWVIAELLREAAAGDPVGWRGTPSSATVLPSFLVLLLVWRMSARSEWLSHDKRQRDNTSRTPLAALQSSSAEQAVVNREVVQWITTAWTALERTRRVLGGVSARFGWDVTPPLWSKPSSALTRAFNHLADIGLESQQVVDLTALGEAVDAVIDRMITEEGKDSDFDTPRNIVDLVASLAEPLKSARVCDPACGIGGFLVACGRRARRSGSAPAHLYGQDVNHWAAAVAQLRLALEENDEARIDVGSTLTEPSLLERDELMKFDVVREQPPLWPILESERCRARPVRSFFARRASS